jgi:transcriptional regulator with XRE-family HTH domain
MSGSQLRRYRRQLGLTQAALAEAIGVTPNTVARWERDEVPINEPAARYVQHLATAHGRAYMEKTVPTKGHRR